MLSSDNWDKSQRFLIRKFVKIREDVHGNWQVIFQDVLVISTTGSDRSDINKHACIFILFVCKIRRWRSNIITIDYMETDRRLSRALLSMFVSDEIWFLTEALLLLRTENWWDYITRHRNIQMTILSVQVHILKWYYYSLPSKEILPAEAYQRDSPFTSTLVVTHAIIKLVQ